MSEINLTFKMDDILTNLVPRIIMEAITTGYLKEKLNDTEYSVSIDYFGSRYGYIIKNGTDLEVRREGVGNPTIYAQISEGQSVQIKVDEKKIMTDLGPRLIGEFMKISGASADLEGTVFTMVIALSENNYGYTVENGRNIMVNEGGIDVPMVRIIAAREEIEGMIDPRNSDVLLALGSQGRGLNLRARFDALKALKGKIIINLENQEGKSSSITFILNNAKTPEVAFTMSMESMLAIMTKRDHPTQLFMSGAMQIDGDIGFAMQTQSLFI